jgi:predicted RNA-binding protein Jag
MLKSFLHQSSDLNRAITEAWEQSNRPNVFTVKIIDAGKKGFLGFSHRPAKISFTYEYGVGKINPGDQLKSSQKTHSQVKSHIAEKTFTTDRFSQQIQKNVNGNHDKNSTAAKPTIKNVLSEEPRPGKTTIATASSKNAELHQKKAVVAKESTTQKSVASDVAAAKPVDTASLDNWTEPLAQQAAAWLKGFCLVFAQEVDVEVAAMQNELLNIQLTGVTLQDSSLGILFKDNLFVCACATLVVQSLRNQNGQRFKGLKIRISV